MEDAVTAMELYRLVEVQWEQQEAGSLPACPEDREPDSGTDTEQYMEDRYWPEDPAQGPSGGAGERGTHRTEASEAREAPGGLGGRRVGRGGQASPGQHVLGRTGCR